MRRTRIKGVANIPQRKKVDLSQKAEEDGKNKTDVTITGHDGSIKACPTKSENTETETKIAQEEIIERTEKADIHKSIDVHSKVCPPQLENIEAGRKIIKEEIIQRTGIADIDNSKNVSGFDCSTEQKELQKIIKEDILSFEETEEDKNISAASSTENEKNISILENVIVRNASEALESFEIVNETTSSSLIENVIEEPKKKLLPLTRAIKPKIPVCPSNKRAQKGEEILKNINNNENVNRIDINSDINEKSEREAHEKTASKEQNVLVHPQSPQISINSPGIRRLKSPVNNVMNIRKIASPHASGGSDTEYPPPPASPNKVNRNRIKAIPRLGYRKISFSASESEDESKRSSQRTRNDSQSSNISEIQESIPEQPMTPKAKEFSSVIHRKCRRTEWSRKLAEARREFTRKFLYGKPDHKKLTMIDLIFYNPTTNQLKKENKTSISETKEDEKTEEDVDNPSEKEEDPPDNSQVEEDTKISDEENEMPAPQIKIGPSGEIILDEKSLTIENKQTKKNREDLQKSKLIDGNSDRPYGVFRKIKRSKDWSQSETLRFYKALSTIGTDFSLMCELFPNRTRRELKMKFKKEEKINQSLIDQAVMEPCSFDFEELKKEFQLVEIEKRELEKQKMMSEKLKKNKENRRSIKLMNLVNLKQENHSPKIIEEEPILPSDNSKMKENITQETIEIEDRENSELTSELSQIKQKKRKKPPNIMKKVRQQKLDINSVLSDSDSNDSDCDEELVRVPTQTRYGRQIKKRQRFEPESELSEELIVPRKIHRPPVEEQPCTKPGSLMMVSSTTPDGQPVVQIFMVTDKNVPNDHMSQGLGGAHSENLLPIAMIQTNRSDAEEEEEIVENNYTIPADPDVIDLSLKTQ